MLEFKKYHAAGARVILTSFSDAKLDQVKESYNEIEFISYATNPEWHEKVFAMTNGFGADIVIENGGASTLVKSMKATRKQGTVSSVGYLGKRNPADSEEIIPCLNERAITLR
jgi:NADPH:quinone reductase-like Zn-dependent oxidoreductase